MAEPFLRIGQLAERTGVSSDSIRHYERLGLLPAPGRTSGGYRLFPPAAVQRVQLIRSAVRVGFSLRELGAFMAVRQAGGAPCRQVRAAAERILETVDQQMVELRATRNSLRGMLREWDVRLERTPPSQPAHLLDTLGPNPARRPAPGANLKRAR